MRSIHEGRAAGRAAEAEAWQSAITATDEERIYVRGRAVDDAIGHETYAGMVLRLWTGRKPTAEDAALFDACLVAAVDHGPLAPSALVARTVTSTGAPAMTSLAAGITAFGPLHGAAVTSAMRLLADLRDVTDDDEWGQLVFERERAAGRRIPGVGHRWHSVDRRSERLLAMVTAQDRPAAPVGRIRGLAAAVGRHAGHPVAVNIDGALAAALTALGVDPAYGDFAFALSRAAGLSAHIVEESLRQRPMRLIQPTLVTYDGPPIEQADGSEGPSPRQRQRLEHRA